MSFFNSIFGSSSDKDQKVDFWKDINSDEDLQNAIQQSNHQKVVIFKHSTRCHISKTVLRNFEKQVEKDQKEADYYFLDLLAHRDLSYKIADELNIEHQSPQLIVLENGKAKRNASHHSITNDLV